MAALGQKEAVAIEVAQSSNLSSPQTANGWVFSVRRVVKRGLKKVPALGGTPVSIVTTSERFGGGTWRADGTIVFATSAGLYQVSEGGGEPRLLVKPNPLRKERAYAWPRFMPDEPSVLFTVVPEGSIDGAGSDGVIDISVVLNWTEGELLALRWSALDLEAALSQYANRCSRGSSRRPKR